jgi:hypothetical protein
MKILINDKLQSASGVPKEIITPMLSDIYNADTEFTATFEQGEKINCIGIGYTDATEVYIEAFEGLETRTIEIEKLAPYHNGLYIFEQFGNDAEEFVLTFDSKIATLDGAYWKIENAVNYPSKIKVSHNGTFIGRVAVGEYRKLGVNPTMEIGFYTTNESRITESGQIIPGAGGMTGRTFDADIRYKFDRDVYNDLELAYRDQISRGFPYFLLLDDEQHKLPANMLRFYGGTDSPLSKLQSSTYKFLYSYRFEFKERF